MCRFARMHCVCVYEGRLKVTENAFSEIISEYFGLSLLESTRRDLQGSVCQLVSSCTILPPGASLFYSVFPQLSIFCKG